MARPILERDSEYNLLNSSHEHSLKNDLSFNKTDNLNISDEDENFSGSIKPYNSHKSQMASN